MVAAAVPCASVRAAPPSLHVRAAVWSATPRPGCCTGWPRPRSPTRRWPTSWRTWPASAPSTGAWAAAADLLARASRLTDDATLRELRLARAADALVGSGDALAAAALLPEVESLRETPLRNAVLGYLAVVRGRPARPRPGWAGRGTWSTSSASPTSPR